MNLQTFPSYPVTKLDFEPKMFSPIEISKKKSNDPSIKHWKKHLKEQATLKSENVPVTAPLVPKSVNSTVRQALSNIREPLPFHSPPIPVKEEIIHHSVFIKEEVSNPPINFKNSVSHPPINIKANMSHESINFKDSLSHQSHIVKDALSHQPHIKDNLPHHQNLPVINQVNFNQLQPINLTSVKHDSENKVQNFQLPLYPTNVNYQDQLCKRTIQPLREINNVEQPQSINYNYKVNAPTNSLVLQPRDLNSQVPKSLVLEPKDPLQITSDLVLQPIDQNLQINSNLVLQPRDLNSLATNNSDLNAISKKPYQCLQCKKQFSTEQGHAKHEQYHCKNQNMKNYLCRYCNKSYTSLSALKMHIRTHTLPCKCDVCGKCFSRPWLLQGHLRTHTGEKPFKCEYCTRSFADKSNLRAHLQTHLQTKKYSCPACQKTFSRVSLLNKHINNACTQYQPSVSVKSNESTPYFQKIRT